MLFKTYDSQLSPSRAVSPICLRRHSMVEPCKASLLGAVSLSTTPPTSSVEMERLLQMGSIDNHPRDSFEIRAGTSWSLFDEEALSTPRDSSALTAFHPSVPSPALSPQSSRLLSSSRCSSTGALEDKHSPSLPSCAPPVDVIPPRAELVGPRMKMRKTL